MSGGLSQQKTASITKYFHVSNNESLSENQLSVFLTSVADMLADANNRRDRINRLLIGMSVLMIWLLSLGAGALAGVLSGRWVVLPCIGLIPPAFLVMINFVNVWLRTGCPLIYPLLVIVKSFNRCLGFKNSGINSPTVAPGTEETNRPNSNNISSNSSQNLR